MCFASSAGKRNGSILSKWVPDGEKIDPKERLSQEQSESVARNLGETLTEGACTVTASL
jgi:hypothetical protein